MASRVLFLEFATRFSTFPLFRRERSCRRGTVLTCFLVCVVALRLTCLCAPWRQGNPLLARVLVFSCLA